MDELDLRTRFEIVRRRTLELCAPLTVEDHALQSLPDASPAKWHLAHSTWFFEAFVLAPHGHAPHDPSYAFLFNSYYESLGQRVERSRRGLLSRPSLADVLAYRRAIDEQLAALLAADRLDTRARSILELGIHHEQQHQELILTDVKHGLGSQPSRPAYRRDLERTAARGAPLSWLEYAGGTRHVGAPTSGFAYDHERQRHRVIVEPFALASRPLSNADVLAFIDDGGYCEPRLWLAAGFAIARRQRWRAPLYWEQHDGVWLAYDLTGLRPVDPATTACHVSYYEADAIARWLGARLPTEQEWEVAAAPLDPRRGHYADDDVLHPRTADGPGIAQLFGDVWEWTSSAYAPYPGFAPLAGALGEYNGKFMSGQIVLRGGSCFSPRGHLRASYRNFFPPSARWQMTGARLAKAS